MIWDSTNFWSSVVFWFGTSSSVVILLLYFSPGLEPPVSSFILVKLITLTSSSSMTTWAAVSHSCFTVVCGNLMSPLSAVIPLESFSIVLDIVGARELDHVLKINSKNNSIFFLSHCVISIIIIIKHDKTWSLLVEVIFQLILKYIVVVRLNQ